MILFKPEHVAPILEGRKTQTRRLGRRRWNVGAVHQARTRMMDADSTFARLRIVDVRRERLLSLDDDGARAEGYPDRAAFLEAWLRINPKERLVYDPEVWVVEFEVAS